MPVCFLYPAFVGKHTERQKGRKPRGIVTVSSAPNLGLNRTASAPQLLPALANPKVGETARDDPGLVGVSRMMDRAGVLLIDILRGFDGGLGP